MLDFALFCKTFRGQFSAEGYDTQTFVYGSLML